MYGTLDPEKFRVVTSGDREIVVQLGPVSAEYALATANPDGVYTGVLALEPGFYQPAIEGGNIDSFTDDLVERLHRGLHAYGASERIVGFDHENDLVLVQVSNDVCAAADEDDDHVPA
ncbi:MULTISPECIES: hypothetical protein [unclassified Microbacterium]|uniref:hypothetical protein n=1 Tax=unclassified Microbacterium TaxID=2609290 RepID=UPI0028833011|nr:MULTISPECIES: hypothetical protein [unclassified Microbacterium]